MLQIPTAPTRYHRNKVEPCSGIKHTGHMVCIFLVLFHAFLILRHPCYIKLIIAWLLPNANPVSRRSLCLFMPSKNDPPKFIRADSCSVEQVTQGASVKTARGWCRTTFCHAISLPVGGGKKHVGWHWLRIYPFRQFACVRNPN